MGMMMVVKSLLKILAAFLILYFAECDAEDDTSSRIALISSSNRAIPGYESGGWSGLDSFWEDWKFILDEKQWHEIWNGHPSSNLNLISKKFMPVKVGITSAWRVVTERLNRAYAAKHGYDFYYARFDECPGRWASWCAMFSSRYLLDMTKQNPSSMSVEYKYKWVIVFDEDVWFNNWDVSVEYYLHSLKNRSRYEAHNAPENTKRPYWTRSNHVSLDEIALSTNAYDYHIPSPLHTKHPEQDDEEDVCFVVGKDFQNFPGVNTGTLILHNTLKTRHMLDKLWKFPLDSPYVGKKYLTEFAYEQSAMTLAILHDKEFNQCAHVVPQSDFFGNSLFDMNSNFMFHNTGGLCGRPHVSPRPGMTSAKKSDCLDELYGKHIYDLMKQMPDTKKTLCDIKADQTIHFAETRDSYNVTVYKHCLSKDMTKNLPPIFFGFSSRSNLRTGVSTEPSKVDRVANVTCLTPSCSSFEERMFSIQRGKQKQEEIKRQKQLELDSEAKLKQEKVAKMKIQWEATHDSSEPFPESSVREKLSAESSSMRKHHPHQRAVGHFGEGNLIHGGVLNNQASMKVNQDGVKVDEASRDKNSLEHLDADIDEKDKLFPDLVYMKDLPKVLSDNQKQLSKFAYVTLITQSNGNYVAGAATLVQSLVSSGTIHRIVVAITDDVLHVRRLGQYFKVLGAESCLLDNIEHTSQLLNHQLRRKLQQQVGGLEDKDHDRYVNDNAVGETRRRLDLRWKGMFTKILLWRQWGQFDKIVYLDSDHIVLHNIDRIFDICNDDLCAVNDPTQSEKKMWDRHYFNAGLMLLKPNNDDFAGLLNAIFNNTLTGSKKKNAYDRKALSDLRSFPKHSWFTGGKDGSLLEQDLLNVYFITRVTYLAPGYNIWAKVLNTYMIPGAFYGTQQEVDKFVSPRVHVIHGNLWDATDGYRYYFPIETRRLWFEFYRKAVYKLFSEFIVNQKIGDNRYDDMFRWCFLCDDQSKSQNDTEVCWMKCVYA